MNKFVLKNAERAGGETYDLKIENGFIKIVRKLPPTDAAVIECTDLIIFPGFIDVHNHGAVGVDVNEADADGLVEVGRFLARNGVTAWMPTLVPDRDENYRRVIGEIEKVVAFQAEMPIAQIVGVHYEGVFANEKMCGALRPEFFKQFMVNHPAAPATPSTHHPADEASAPLLKPGGELSDLKLGGELSGFKLGGEFLDLPRLKTGVHMTTFAPEIEGGIELAAELKRQGWIAAIGHSHADAATLDAAFAAGARHVTHFFNAMSGVHHRDLGVAGWALTTNGATFDIIADGIHVDDRMLEFAARSKGTGQVSLISDSIAPTGLGDGNYELWSETVAVENGRTRNDRGSIAGSVITMRDAVNRMKRLGFDDAELAKMASANPARLLGLDKTRGSIAVGMRADLVALDASGAVAWAMIGGRLVD